MCGGRSDDSSQDTSGSYNEAAANFRAAQEARGGPRGRQDYDGGNITDALRSEDRARSAPSNYSNVVIGNNDDNNNNNNTPFSGNNNKSMLPGVDNIFGSMENYDKFMENRVNSIGSKIGSGIKSIMGMGPVSMGLKAMGLMNSKPDRPNIDNILNYAEANPNAVTLGEDGLSLSIDTGSGTLNVGKSGFTTYSGTQNPDYDGPFANLVNPPKDDGDDDNQQQRPQTPLDPCPTGFKFNSATNSCEPVATSATNQTMGTEFVRNTQFPANLSNYGQVGGEYKFFNEMPGIIKAKDGIPRGPHGEIKGAGGPKDDLVGPFMLSSQEYVEPYERVLDEGNGSYERGIRVLEKKRMKALRKYSDRVKSEERQRA